MIPDRWNEKQKQYFGQVFNVTLPQVQTRFISNTHGTNDPFLIIDEAEMKKLPHWKDAIQVAAQ